MRAMLMVMSEAKTIRRYAAFFRGWCQAFGEHEVGPEDDETIRWLIGDNQVGMIVPDNLRKALYKEMLGKGPQVPDLVLGDDAFWVGEVDCECSGAQSGEGLAQLRTLALQARELHLFLTYHIIYPAGTRIITFASKGPLGLFYKEIEPMNLRFRERPS